MRITTAQIRAARALLDWSQGDLAERSAVSVTSIGNIEKGATTPREETLQVLQHTFEDAGVEFVDSGVKMRTANVVTFTGREGFRRFYDDIYTTFVGKGGAAFVSNADEQLFVQALGEEFVHMHAARMAEIANLDFKVLVAKNYDVKPGKGFIQYRRAKGNIASNVPFYVYGTKFATILFGAEPTAIVIDYPAVAEAYKEQFLLMWKEAV